MRLESRDKADLMTCVLYQIGKKIRANSEC